MDTSWIQALANMASLLTITFFAKRLLLKDEEALLKRWPVVGLIASDSILAVGHVLIIGHAYSYENDRFINLCKLQGFVIHFGMQASFMWLNVMTLIMYNSLFTRYEISIHRTAVLCFALPFSYNSV